jgi:uncharacterized protein YggT (Ycf19 family)
MESIFILLKLPIDYVFTLIGSLKPFLLENINGLTSPDLVEALRFLRLGLYVYSQVFQLFLILRLVIYWFPGFNPYIPPFYMVLAVTDPVLRYLAKKLPRVFGIDFSFFLLSTGVSIFINFLHDLKF